MHEIIVQRFLSRTLSSFCGRSMSVSVHRTTKTDQRKKPKYRLEELNQDTSHQDRRLPYDYCDSSCDFQSPLGFLVGLIIVIAVYYLIFSSFNYRRFHFLKELFLSNRTNNYTNNLSFFNKRLLKCNLNRIFNYNNQNYSSIVN